MKLYENSSSTNGISQLWDEIGLIFMDFLFHGSILQEAKRGSFLLYLLGDHQAKWLGRSPFEHGNIMEYHGFFYGFPSGNWLQFAIGNGPFIVDVPIKDGDFP